MGGDTSGNISSSSSSGSGLISNALASAVAGIFSRICTHPLDTAKARLQAVYQGTTTTHVPPPPSTRTTATATSPFKNVIPTNPYRNVRDVLKHTYRTEGIVHGLYRGFGVILLGGTPGTILYLCSYEIAKEKLSSNNPKATTTPFNSDFLIHFSSGMIAETVACVIYVPVDVIKERMQVQHRQAATTTSTSTPTYYKNTLDAIRQISQQPEGFVRGIYRGYFATLASFGPFSALYFMLYEQTKSQAKNYVYQSTATSTVSSSSLLSSRELEQVELSFPWIVLCSCSAGAVASFLTSPLDLAKLRLQVSRGQASAASASSSLQQQQQPSYTGMIDCLQQAYRQGGLRGLFRGAGARVIHFAPATTITMTCYESCRSLVNTFLVSQ